jgi:hypothetical protein
MTSDSLVIAPFVAERLSVKDLDHDVWTSLEPISITHLWSGAAARPERHAEARTCWTDEQLLVRFDCRQHEPLVVSPKPITDRKTIGLWDRDVCEVFLAPDAANPWSYFEFEAAPTGEWIDLGLKVTPEGRVTDWEYQSNMTTAARIEEQSLVITIGIPWSDSIPKPQQGDQWRANFFRCISLDPEERYLAWRPTYAPEPNFHVPDAFGCLCFV